MFVVTADQIGSRSGPDLAGPALEQLQGRFGERLRLPVDRNAGDELQALTADAETALELVLALTRTREWSVGLGLGAVRTPLPEQTREASGDAFVAARAAVTRAKRSPVRLAVEAVADPQPAADAEALLGLLLTLRDARSEAGWELYDLVVSGLTQAEAGSRLGITPQSASDRARAAGLRVELAALPALARLLADADAAQERATAAGSEDE
ncbi:DNA-binding protein [Leifsonia sp. F6_8S_P_1B]|uniref:DNA-binding protein n=1 Tax=Leifsonia williamsii TaxID=3035919 RepID=A0ABT8KBJ9_9MICO|nr:DNA-binding protein [Leifsonia williamsii]MDN4614532.1 DNA-binding protein [Leifsonia williamsii]